MLLNIFITYNTLNLCQFTKCICFRFSRDSELHKIWIHRCKRADNWNSRKYFICFHIILFLTTLFEMIIVG